MKKIQYLQIALMIVIIILLLTDRRKETPKEVITETKIETKIETQKETSKQETKAETPSKVNNQIVKVGLGRIIRLNAKERGENINTEQNAIFAIVSFDKDGKIVKAEIDNAQSIVGVTKEGKFTKPITELEFKTKKELGDNYGMKKASGIKKEWHEQMKSFEEYIVGKTVDEVAEIPTIKRDEGHLNVPSEADLVSSVTIDIGDYQKAVVNAWENAREVKDIAKVSYKAITSLGGRTKEASDGKGANVEFETAIAVVALKEDGTIVESFLDNAQNTVALNADGTPLEDLSEKGTTKVQLGDKYGMKKVSKIGKEWFEQAKSIEDWTKGKKQSDITALEVDDKGKLKDTDLVSSVTIRPSVYLKALSEAAK